ncbi:4-carboxy-4-hydroxy-2-oxoadipate aldolase/oxaloacetate decarboxylase [Cohaesibacter celericrescens]|uniref:4-hydroxy-4-methyl-2-oxoglutarate aldolase n=1 Tax=Cohaesibacter celericrescens TaxID=2067669 RepID=A0A2N5XVR9_9HYPH|nr:4-carboxy-4-hydroxy-2-oxoadipate aldolase/oxaloacetate decarboxylase [Cohaesibacter celericrescens]PLW78594.1 S-adenosylmethionine--2-demethylmenaquinone methyltransferase [Cohaesibacter celericrescens]
MAHVIENIERPDASVVEAISHFTPATIHEAQGRRGAIASRIKPIYNGMTVCGPAITIRAHPGDNIMLQLAISIAKPGDVLVFATDESSEQGCFGEVLGTWAQARGIAGLVTDSGVRDGPALNKNGFSVFSPGLCIKGTVKETPGFINQPISFGGEIINPGDIIVGDDDGLVVVRPHEAMEIAAESKKRDDAEAVLMAKLKEGTNLLEAVGMDKKAEAKGITFDR